MTSQEQHMKRSNVAQIPLEAIDVSDATLYQKDSWRPYFALPVRLHGLP
jgi:hypothetical protein